MRYIVLTYAVLLMIIFGFGAAGIYHTMKYGYRGDKTRAGMAAYIGFFGILLIASLLLLITSPGSEPA